MKKNLFLLAAVTAFAFYGCSNAEDYVQPAASTAQFVPSPKALEYDASLFPAPDKSQELNPRNLLANFNKLIIKANPERGLERKEIDVNDEQLQEIKTFTDDLVKAADTPLKKLELLNAWLKNTVRYEYADNSSYAVFKNRKAICQGYSNLLRTMLYTQNIPSVAVNGVYKGIGGHAWVYAYVNNAWYVADPTNNLKPWRISNTAAYSHLLPEMANIDIFEDDNFVYNYNESYLNIKEVKKGTEILVIPYSIKGFRIGSFNPSKPLPTGIRHVYIGSNIHSLGESFCGLKAYRSFDEAVFVDPQNADFGSEHGIVYRRDFQKKLTSLFYIPSQMRSVKLRAMEKVEKNTVYNHSVVEEIIILPGTKKLENYAIESCGALRRLYIPEDCEMDEQALYLCPEGVEIMVGDFTGIAKVKK